jgi:hypothetical protein
MQWEWEDKNRNGYKIAIYWCKKDVENVAASIEISLTGEEISDVLRNVLENHDSTYGITWDNIRCEIEDIVRIRDGEDRK